MTERALIIRLSPELKALEQQAERCQARVVLLAEGLSQRELAARPDPAAWSIVECIDHLNSFTRASLTRVDMALSRAELAAPSERRFRVNRLMRPLLRAYEPPVKRLRSKAVPDFVPPTELDARSTLEDYYTFHEERIKQLYLLADYDLSDLIIQSPVNRWIRYNAYEWLLFLFVHERRHLWQAEGVRKQLEDPDED